MPLPALFRDIADFIYPTRCAACDDTCLQGDWLCTRCTQGMENITAHAACEKCALPIVSKGAPCPWCRGRGVYPFDGIARLGKFDGPLRDMIHHLKYHRRWSIAEHLAAQLLKYDATKTILTSADILIPVPLHWSRQISRGYNQADVIAAAIAAGTKLKVGNIIRRLRSTHSVTVKGDRAVGFCPLPTHNGQRRSPSFSVDMVRGIWQCFGCGAKGNVLDFASRMEGFDPANPQELRKAALKIADVFHLGGQVSPPLAGAPATKPQTPSKPVLINAPIDFELKSLDPDHPYLKERGFTEETIRHFGLGFCNRGLLKSRAAIPIHNPQGRLVGYAGRITREDMISEKCPKYLLPGERERNGTILEFRKLYLLYNAHRIKGPVDHLFVVEGFPSTWWLWQAKFPNTVALMGASCSPEQAKVIVDLVKPDGKVWVIPDGNAAGVQCAKRVLEQVSPYRFIRWIPLVDNKQPTDFSPEELVTLLGY